MKVNELFAGIGAFRQAFIRQGIPHKIIGISEIDKYALKSYEAIYGETHNYGDISEVERLDYADMWTYGFPCQDLSVIKKNRQGLDGTRSGLVYEVERLLRVAKKEKNLPKYLIMENVPTLVGKYREGFDIYLQRLWDIGYDSTWKIMNARYYGIPQMRRRVICVSVRKDIDRYYAFPFQRRLKVFMKDLLEKSVDPKYYLTERFLIGAEAHNEKYKGQFHFNPQIDECAFIARTITANPTSYTQNYIIDDGGVRRITPLEAWRLMGFRDEDFRKAQKVCSDAQLYRQAGNSVVVDMLACVLQNVVDYLERDRWQ